MANNNNPERWYFSKDQIRNSPSVKDDIEHAKELGYRQQCANLIQDIGQRLQVTQLVINTAIVYMHRFYMLHSFSTFKRNTMGPCFLFLAAKVEEQPRRLEHVLKATHLCLTKDGPAFDPKSDEYMKLQQELVDNESVLLQTLGFEVAVDHPNTYVVKCVQLVKASKELAQTAYFLATNSLHLTVFCIQYKPTVVACVCIYVACLWAHYVIPETESKNWYEFIDNTVTKNMLEELSSYFIKILDSCPTRLKKRLTTGGAMVYKEGKVIAKKESSTTVEGDGKEASSSKSLPTPEIASKGERSKEPSVKTHLKELLKPQPHHSTPPPKVPSSASKLLHHQKKVHEHKSSSDSHKKLPYSAAQGQPHQEQRKAEPAHTTETKHSEGRVTDPSSKTSTSKSYEQSKIEQRKKWTPQQIEDYRKRKEKEKLMQQHQQRKRDAERNERDPSTSKLLNTAKTEESVSRLKRPHPSDATPIKRQRTEGQHTKQLYPENSGSDRVGHGNDEKSSKSMMYPILDSQRNSTLSSSGSDSETSNTPKSTIPKKTKSRHTLNFTKHTQEQKASIEGSVNPLPPPPPPPRFSGSNINITSQSQTHATTSTSNVRNHSNPKQFSTPPKFV